MAATTIEPAEPAEPAPESAERSTGTAQASKAETAPARAPVAERMVWRAVVRTGGQIAARRERERIEWHLAACAAPRGEGTHCTEGQHLIETVGHPDGHCILDGACGVCGQPAAAPSD
jgi:hypothetical protein